MNRNIVCFLMVGLSAFALQVAADDADNSGVSGGERMVDFAGLRWNVKLGFGGPGPNYWLDSEENVWVDSAGWLHLRIRSSGDTWYCSEVYTIEPTSYGKHRFYVVGRIDTIDRNVVFAPFLYHNDETEVDIEFARWGQINPPTSGQYVVQPGGRPGNLERFPIELTGTHSTHYFNWQSDSIRFRSIHGHYPEPPGPDYLIHEWLYTGTNNPPQDSNLRVHINLWLFQGNPPANGCEQEVVVSSADLPGQTSLGGPADVDPVRPCLAVRPLLIRVRAQAEVELPEPSYASLCVLDSRGDVVSELLGRSMPAGRHRCIWDGTNTQGRRLPAGIYFCCLKAGEFTVTRKIVKLE